jgi:predicted DNA-binding protein
MPRKYSTTVYLTESQHGRLKVLRERTGVSMAEYIRQGIDMVLHNHRDNAALGLAKMKASEARNSDGSVHPVHVAREIAEAIFGAENVDAESFDEAEAAT